MSYSMVRVRESDFRENARRFEAPSDITMILFAAGRSVLLYALDSFTPSVLIFHCADRPSLIPWKTRT